MVPLAQEVEITVPPETGLPAGRLYVPTEFRGMAQASLSVHRALSHEARSHLAGGFLAQPVVRKQRRRRT